MFLLCRGCRPWLRSGSASKEFWRQYPNVLGRMWQQAVAPFEMPVPPLPKKPRYPNLSRAADASADQLLLAQQPPCVPSNQPATVFDNDLLPFASKGPLPEHNSPRSPWELVSPPCLVPHRAPSTSSDSCPAEEAAHWEEEPLPGSTMAVEFPVARPPSASLPSCGTLDSCSQDTSRFAADVAAAAADTWISWRCGALSDVAEVVHQRILTTREPGGLAPGGQLSHRGPRATEQHLFPGPWGSIEQPLVTGSLPRSSDDASLWLVPQAGCCEWDAMIEDTSRPSATGNLGY